MAKAGRGQTRRDSKRRVLRPGESIRADKNINTNIILMAKHILYIAGGLSLRINCHRAKALYVTSRNGKAGQFRSGSAHEYHRW